MKVPKEIKKLLKQRREYAEALQSVAAEVDTWLEDHGANMCAEELQDHIISGCEMYTNPGISEKVILDYIEQKM